MKFGCQTIIFSRRIDDLEYVLSTIASLGFKGVEFSQRPEDIWIHEQNCEKPFDTKNPNHRQATITDIVILLKRYNLEFLGLAGGTLEDRVIFCSNLDAAALQKKVIPESTCHPQYCYAEDFDENSILKARKYFINLAFHPHAFTKFERVDIAEKVFPYDVPNVHWLLDTGHISVTGEDPVEVLSRIPIEKLIGVHLKDYNPAYGRSYHRYAKGFVPLGQGNVDILGVLKTLEDRRYQGWVILEQDFPHDDPVKSLQVSVGFLSSNGYDDQFKPNLGVERKEHDRIFPQEPQGLGIGLFEFFRKIYRAGESDLATCYHEMAAGLNELLIAEHITLWSTSASHDDLYLLASYPDNVHSENEPMIRDKRVSLLGEVSHPLSLISRKVEGLSEEKFTYRNIALQLKADTVIAMSLPNRYNQNAIRLKIGVITKEHKEFDYSRILDLIASDIARAANDSLDDACSVAAGEVGQIVALTDTLEEFLKKLGELVQKHIKCQGLTIFLANRTQERLEERWTTGITWRAELGNDEKYYQANELDHPTVQCWQRSTTILLSNASQQVFGGDSNRAKSSERVSQNRDYDNILIVPLVSAEQQKNLKIPVVIGVIRCKNKKPRILGSGTEVYPYLTEDDSAILAAICQAAAPYIEQFMRDVQIRQSYAYVMHELSMPINTLRAATDRMRAVCGKEGFDTKKVKDLAEDMISWTGLMGKVIEGAGLYGAFTNSNQPINLQTQKILLMGDVIAPLKPMMRPLLEDRGFDVGQIEYGDFRDIPPLYLDRNLIQQVFFNLMSNSIKYAFDNPAQFHIKINPKVIDGNFIIDCEDWGPGVPEKDSDTIFSAGVRGPEYLNRLVRGMGIGLWIARRIVEAHGGTLTIVYNYMPTTFRICLPHTLRSSPPKNTRRREK